MRDAYQEWCNEQKQLEEVQRESWESQKPVRLIGAGQCQAEFQRVSKAWLDLSGTCDPVTRFKKVEDLVRRSDRLEPPQDWSTFNFDHIVNDTIQVGNVTFAGIDLQALDQDVDYLAPFKGATKLTHPRPKPAPEASPIRTTPNPPEQAEKIAPPGGWMLLISEYLVNKRTRERIIEPIIRDMRDEHHDAMMRGKTTLAAIIRIRGTWSVVSAIGRRLPLRDVLRWLGLTIA